MANYQVLLVPINCGVFDLVYIRLFRLFIWNILLCMVEIDFAKYCASVEVIWLVCYEATPFSIILKANRVFVLRNTVINLFYVPGAMIGAFVSDWAGPRYTLAAGVFAQGIVGFIMSGLYATLATPAHVAGFVVVYGYVSMV